MAGDRWQELKGLLQETVSDFVGRVEYGNLRVEVYESEEGAAAGAVSRVALAFEMPGGSTNQFAVSYEDGAFHMLDANAEEVLALTEPAQVAESVLAQISDIPQQRLQRLRDEIDGWIRAGHGRTGVFDELNRVLRMGHELRGGSLTVEELTAGCSYTVQRFAKQEADA